MTNATATRRATDGPAPPLTPAAVVNTRRRAPMRTLLGLLIIAVGFVTGAVVLTHVNKAIDVLAVARPVSAGATLTGADLSTVAIVPDPSLHVIAAAQRSTVVGQTAAMPLAQGSLLTTGQIGTVVDPGAGQALVALGVTDGHLPAGLSAGASVLVLVVPSSTTGTALPVQTAGVIRDVDVPDSAGMTVVTVQMAAAAATRIDAAPGNVSIIVQGH